MAEPYARGRRRRPGDVVRPVYRIERHGYWHSEVDTLDEVAAALGEHFAHLVPAG